MGQLHSALFIDYDNVRSELERYDPNVASRFSNKTMLWLEALEKHLALPQGHGEEERRIVSRRCYASPHRINSYRRNFTQTGFEVIDCPPLTTHLKNSADIYIVMDVIDYLLRYPHIDEYIILSADADFVPVLNRLRKELKRSVIFTSYNTTAAYRNCSDRTIEADFFARHLAADVAPRASAVQSQGTARAAGRTGLDVDEAFADEVEACLIRAADRHFGHISFAAAGLVLREELKDRLGNDWGGHRTMSALVDKVPFKVLEVRRDAQEFSNPDFRLELPGWSEEDRARLQEFVSDIACAASKAIPALPPAEYTLLFDELSGHYDAVEEPGTFTDAVNAVSKRCRDRGGDISAQDVRFVATGISMQGYRFGEGDRIDATLLAGLWRVQVFDLCRDPDWLREPDDALLLATWFRASSETPEAGRDDFLRRTADEAEEAAAE